MYDSILHVEKNIINTSFLVLYSLLIILKSISQLDKC